MACFAAALHDLGKFAEAFQSKAPMLFEQLRGRPPARFGGPRHDVLSSIMWRHMLPNIAQAFAPPLNADHDLLNDLLQFVYEPSAGHHGKPVNALDTVAVDSFTDVDMQAARDFTLFVQQLFLTPHRPIALAATAESLETFRVASWRLAGLIVLCDWIASVEEFFPYVSTFIPLEEYWHAHALPHARAALAASGVLPASPSRQTGMAMLFPAIKTPTALQHYAETCPLVDQPQLFIVEDLTGSGKTEAALVLAHRLMLQGLADGLYFALPTMATANAMYDRLAKAYDRLYQPDAQPSLVLAHSARSLSERFRDACSLSTQATGVPAGEPEARAQCNAWFADQRKKALLAHVGVGTIDQALAAILPAYHQSLRLLGLQRKVLIVDEVHACDTYMYTLLQSLLEFHAALGGCAILLSASLPQKMRRELAAAFARGAGLPAPVLHNNSYPLVTHLPAACAERTMAARPQLCRHVNIRMLHDERDVLDFVRQKLGEGRCVCWIRNTVHDASSAYEALKNDVAHITLFHARFAMGDRLKLEQVICDTFGPQSTPDQRRGRLVIATQVVEQSLDLDFDELVTDLAPMDRIIQRAGRLHRHLRPERSSGPPTITIFSPPLPVAPHEDWYAAIFPKAAYVYPLHALLWRTAQCLAARRSWRQPDDIRAMIETAYNDDAPAPDALMRRDQRPQAELLSAQSLALFNALKLKDGYNCTGCSDWADDNFAPTRLGDDTITLRLARWDGQRLLPWCQTNRFPWAMSEVRVRRRLVAHEAPCTGALAAAVNEAKQSMPDKCRYALLIVLQEHDGNWSGPAVNAHGKEILIQYSDTLGLTIEQGEHDALQFD